MNPIAIAVLQLFLTALASYGLWRLWALYVSRTGGDRVLKSIAAAGFLLRAVGGQVLFWISWLRLPVLPSLQLGNGFWFFAIDSYWYLRSATRLLRGELEMFTLSTQYAAHTFVEILALFVAIGGSVASVGILLNCAAYLAAAIVILRFPSAGRVASIAALAALSLAPGALLWSLQPLKDSLFALTVIAFVAALSAWRQRRGKRISIVVAILGLLYVQAGMRWYFAVIAWTFAGMFILWTAFREERRRVAVAGGVVLFALGMCAVRLGAAGDMVPVIEHTMGALGREAPAVSVVEAAPRYVAVVRRGFDDTPGATRIGVGPVSDVGDERGSAAKVAAPPVAAAPALPEGASPPPQIVPQPVAPPPPSQEMQAAPGPVAPAAEGAAHPVAAAPARTEGASPPPQVIRQPVAPSPSPSPQETQAAPGLVAAPVAPPAEGAASPVAAAPARAEGAAPPVAAAPARTEGAAPPVAAAPARTEVSSPPPEVIPQPVAPSPQEVQAPTPGPAAPASLPPSEGAVTVPQSLPARILTGAAATFLPRSVAQALGLVDIRGGRGLWMVVEIDTLVFDALLLFTIGYVVFVLRRRRASVTPQFLLVLAVFAVVAAGLVYSVSNFGTLFRLRQMLGILAALLPLTLRHASPREEAR